VAKHGRSTALIVPPEDARRAGLRPGQIIPVEPKPLKVDYDDIAILHLGPKASLEHDRLAAQQARSGRRQGRRG
jgi:hypothetical protein